MTVRLDGRRWKGEQVAFQHRRHVAADKFAPGIGARTRAVRIAWRNASPKYLQVAILRVASLGYSATVRTPGSFPVARRRAIVASTNTVAPSSAESRLKRAATEFVYSCKEVLTIKDFAR